LNHLRRDIHSAFEVIEPSLGGMPERVVHTVLAGKRRRRKELMAFRLRISFALVAALLLVAVITAAALTWNSLHNVSPAGGFHLTPQQQTELTVLEARPIVLPTIQQGAACPYTGIYNNVISGTVVAGSGPVYRSGAVDVGRSDRGSWYAPTLIYAPQRPGLVLVRGRDLLTNQQIVFAQYSLGPSAAAATGPQLGTDQLNGKKIQLYSEAVLPDQSQTQPNSNADLILMFAVPRPTLCWGLQWDGPGFSETFVNGWDSLADKGP
jgi:hypothetical protein